MGQTKPVPELGIVGNEQTVVAPHIRTNDGAEYVHKDLVKVVDPWEVENHIGAPSGEERFETIGSWAEFVKRYGKTETTLLMWNDHGFEAQLDYHDDGTNASTGEAVHESDRWGRDRWTASMPFVYSTEWNDWSEMARRPHGHREVIEFVEDHAPDIKRPDAAAIGQTLQTLRANVNSTAVTTLKPDGSTHVDFTQTRSVAGSATQKQTETELPQAIEIAIPVLKGHIDDKGQPVRYKLTVRVRPSVDDEARLTFRFTIPQADQVKEEVLQEQVADAQTRLTGFPLYRGG